MDYPNHYYYRHARYQPPTPARPGQAQILGAAILLALFTLIACSLMMGWGWVAGLDDAIRTPIYSLQNVLVGWLFNALCFLGDTKVVIVLSAGVCVALAVVRSWKRLGFFAGTMIIGEGLLYLLKAAFDRMRPIGHNLVALPDTASFPSGHTFGSCLFFVLVALMLGAYLKRQGYSLGLSRLPLIVAAVITFLIGFARIYLGVHWPTDVLAAWLLAAALICLAQGWMREES
jgi:undecaprenyl-diphosphatase